MRNFKFENILFHDDHIAAQTFSVNKELGQHTHDFIELIYIKNGTGIQVIDGISYPVSRGSFLFVNHGQTHAIQPEGELSYIEVMFDLEFISQELINKNNAFDILSLSSFGDLGAELDETVPPLVHFSGEELYAVEHLLKDLVREISLRQPLYKNVIHGYVETLLSKLMRKLATNLPDGLQAEKQDALYKIMEYINHNYAEEITLETLAERSFYNPSYFSRIFKNRFGMGFKTYITKLRTDKAAELLKTTDLPIKDVLTRCGFNDKNAFYRALEHWYGTTPSGLRGK